MQAGPDQGQAAALWRYPGVGMPWSISGRGPNRNREGFSSFAFCPWEALGGSWLFARGPGGGPEPLPAAMGYPSCEMGGTAPSLILSYPTSFAL